jgi:cellulose synthase/poly-beta-1,6-N-acetylglucosamine synthase-like glycosyltransferase
MKSQRPEEPGRSGRASASIGNFRPVLGSIDTRHSILRSSNNILLNRDSMNVLGLAAVAFATALVAYTYAGYPLTLKILSLRGRGKGLDAGTPDRWPDVTITVALYNEEGQAEGLLESLTALDYPAEKRQILIVSDGSTDRTNEIVSRYLDRGIDFLPLSSRGGKTAAENAAAEKIRADIVVNTDASTRILPSSLKPLIAAMGNPRVGLASGRDLSVSRTDQPANLGESGYV